MTGESEVEAAQVSGSNSGAQADCASDIVVIHHEDDEETRTRSPVRSPDRSPDPHPKRRRR